MSGISFPPPAAPVARGAARAPDLHAARDAALRLEAGFLSEMLKAAGLCEGGGTFSGGPGEAQFASFQRDAIAMQMARAGGIGLAERFFAALIEVPHAR